jgi:predicted KAP-like P-loop ATPase
MDQLSADSPITTRNEDALDYWPFAESLAKGLTQRIPKDGFVVGIQAHWGMGKTSAINLILQAIHELESSKLSHEQTKIQNFNPWLFSGLETLARGYLSELGRVIKDTLGDATPRKTSQFVEKLIKGGAEFIGGMTALGAIAVGAAPFAAPLKSAVSGALSYGAHVLDNRSLETMIDDLKAHLMSIDCRILIIVDDLDRLQPDELRQTLTLVKTFGNLPNVTHLLAYDRDIVNSAVEAGQSSGSATERVPTFLEKIVQAEFDLPYPTDMGLYKLINEKFISIFGETPEIEIEDWMLLRRTALQNYLHSPRDVLRLCNALSVIWPSVKGEIYIPDLIAIELLRHHDHATYDLIRGQKEYMIGRGPAGQENRLQLGRRFLESITSTRLDDVSELLATMFPAFAKSQNIQVFHRGGTRILAGRRISDPDGFDAYFRFAPVPDEISVERLRQVAANINDEAFLIAFMKEILGRTRADGTSLMGSFLGHLPRVMDSINPIGPQLLTALLNLGDQIIERRDEEAGFYLMTNQQRLGPILLRVFERVDRTSVRDAIEAAVEDPEVGVGTVAYVVAYIAADHGLVWQRSNEAKSEPILARPEVERIGQKLVKRIEDLARSNTLPITSMTDIILRVWTTFGAKDAARTWIEKNLCDPITFAKIAFSQMGEVSSSSPPYRYRELRSVIDEELFDLPRMLHLGRKHQNSEALDLKDREDLQRFVTSLENHFPRGNG